MFSSQCACSFYISIGDGISTGLDSWSLCGITAASSSLHLGSLRQAIKFCVIPWCFKLCISEWIRVEIICVADVVAIWILKEFTYIVEDIVAMVEETMVVRSRVPTVLPHCAIYIHVRIYIYTLFRKRVKGST